MAQHKHGNFPAELRAVVKPPKKIRARNRARSTSHRDQGKQYSHLVRKYTDEAARSKDTCVIGAQLVERGFITEVSEAIDHLSSHKLEALCHNQYLGNVLKALAEAGKESLVLAIFTKAIKEFPDIVASNHSLGVVFEGLLDSGKTKKAVDKFFELAVSAPKALSENTDTGWIIDQLLDHNYKDITIKAFFVLAKRKPGKFSENPSLPRALRALQHQQTTGVLGSESSNLINMGIGELLKFNKNLAGHGVHR